MRFLPPLWLPHRKLLPVLSQKPRFVKLPLFLRLRKPARKMPSLLLRVRKRLRFLPHRFLPPRFALSTVLLTVLHFSLLWLRRFAVLCLCPRLLLSAVPYFFPLPLLPLMPHFFLPPLLSTDRKPAGFWFCQLSLPPKADFLHRLPDLRAVLLWLLRSGSQADNLLKLHFHTSHSPAP